MSHGLCFTKSLDEPYYNTKHAHVLVNHCSRANVEPYVGLQQSERARISENQAWIIIIRGLKSKSQISCNVLFVESAECMDSSIPWVGAPRSLKSWPPKLFEAPFSNESP